MVLRIDSIGGAVNETPHIIPVEAEDVEANAESAVDSQLVGIGDFLNDLIRRSRLTNESAQYQHHIVRKNPDHWAMMPFAIQKGSKSRHRVFEGRIIHFV